jgi:hypothetical protein
MSRRRRGATPEMVTIYWRDIPAQVNAGQGREKAQAMLSPRFQHAIDRAAGVAGLTDTHSYVQEWRRETGPVDGDLQAAAEAEAQRLEELYDRDRLEALVAAGGVMAPDPAIPVTPTEPAPPTDPAPEDPS